MNQHEYYEAVFPRLKEAFERSSWVLGYGPELITLMNYPVRSLHVTVQPVDQLWKLSKEWGLEVFVPIVGEHGNSILFPYDFEIALMHENERLYRDPGSQLHFFRNHIKPVSNYLENFFTERGIPFVLDFTPSGGHVLFHVLRGTDAWHAVASIGHLEQSLIEKYNFADHTGEDLKRTEPLGLDAGLVFSGLTRLAAYASLMVKNDFGGHQNGMPITISDCEEKTINLDISWCGDPAFMRIMRAPCGLHKKNMDKYGVYDFGPLADVKVTWFDGANVINPEQDLDQLVHAMWNLDHAAGHNLLFPGHIPYANEPLVAFVDEYKQSSLNEFNQAIDREPNLPVGEARHRVINDDRLHEKTRNMAMYPNPRMLTPRDLKKYVRNLMENGWHPRHIGNSIRDCYVEDEGLSRGFVKCDADTKANFWAHNYAAVFLLEEGEDIV